MVPLELLKPVDEMPRRLVWQVKQAYRGILYYLLGVVQARVVGIAYFVKLSQ